MGQIYSRNKKIYVCLEGEKMGISSKRRKQKYYIPQRLTNATNPSRHFTWRIDIMWLHVLGETFLRNQIKFDHSIS